MGVTVANAGVEETSPGADDGVTATGPGGPEAPTPTRSRAAYFSVIVVLVVGLLITAGLSFGARSLHDTNEKRLLKQRAREVGAVVAAAIPAVQTPLASAAVLAESTNGNPEAFRKLMGPIVAAGRPFISVSLWPIGKAAPRPIVVVGTPPGLAAESDAGRRQVIAQAAGKGTVTLNNLLASPDRRLGYALSGGSPAARYVVYAEAALPRDRKANVASNSAFSDLGYALYLGKAPDGRYLMASSTGGALLHGRRESVAVPFGDSHLLVVMATNKELGGTLVARLWWTLAILGLLLTLAAAFLVGRISQQRRNAEVLAADNARLYAQQRTVAQTLQHSLLAEAFPEIGGLEFAARYVAGVEGIDIGGDWYDVVRLERGKVLIVVGDVSGRGLEAATMMAALRFSARAYAAEGHSPALILTKLSGLVSVSRDGHFATVLCGLLDTSARKITLANAGHPDPLLIGPTGAEYIATSIGVPVGVDGDKAYPEVEVSFPGGSTLLLYTDGAIERRGESLDVGLERLRAASLNAAGPLEEFLAGVASGVIDENPEDDTALLGVRWHN